MPSLRERALGYLARREHSRAELARKLSPHGEADEIAALLDALEQERLLSDGRFAESLRHTRQGRYGSLRLRHELQQKGVAAGQAEREVELARVSDLEHARAVWLKKFGAPPADARERARQMRFLLGRGFPMDVAVRVVGGREVD
ncbi:MAG TPA: recombination regulator RecX [Thiobacillaceae bacterium]|nr:recombination regulator RecX [Thiobacillaceae bacterium]